MLVANHRRLSDRPGSTGARASDRLIDRATIDARVIKLFDNPALRGQVHKLEKVELSSVWRLTSATMSRLAARSPEPLSALDVHRRLVKGLAGETLLISSAMFLNNLAEVEQFFGLSFKTIKARLGGSLDLGASEMAMRAGRVIMTAADLFGSHEAGRAYMHARNFALGGAAPAELIKTSDGERVVLDELHAQAESGPL